MHTPSTRALGILFALGATILSAGCCTTPADSKPLATDHLTRNQVPFVFVEPSSPVENVEELRSIDNIHQAAYAAVSALPGFVDDPRGGSRLLSLRMPGEEIPLDLKPGIYRNAQYLWRLSDAVPKGSHLYSRSQHTVFEALEQIYTEGSPLPGYGGSGAIHSAEEMRVAERTLFRSASVFGCGPMVPRQEYEKYKYYAAEVARAQDELSRAIAENRGVESATTALDQARVALQRQGYKEKIEPALAVLSASSGDPVIPWISGKARLTRASRSFAIGDVVPNIDFTPRYEDWRSEHGWTSVVLVDIEGRQLGSMSVRIVGVQRSWMDWGLLQPGMWQWRNTSSLLRHPVSTGQAFDSSAECILPLVPVSLVLARDVIITDAARGFALEDNSRDHVRLIGVISVVVPPCP